MSGGRVVMGIKCSEPRCMEYIPSCTPADVYDKSNELVGDLEYMGWVVTVENDRVIVFCEDHAPLTWCRESDDHTHLWQVDPDAPYGVMCGWCDQEVLPPGTDPRALVKEEG